MPRDPHKDQPILQGGAALGDATGALILLHGRAGSAQEMLTLARELDVSPPSPEGRGGQGVRPDGGASPVSESEGRGGQGVRRAGSAQEMLTLARELDVSPPSPEGRGGQGVRPDGGASSESEFEGRGGQGVRPPRFAWFVPEAAGRQWYPYSLLEKVEKNQSAMNSALGLVKRILEKAAAANIPAEHTVLLGFSQGATVALEYAARTPRRYGAVIAFSGALLGPEGTPRDYAGSLAGTPVFLGSGDRDPNIPKRRVDEAVTVFERLGAVVTKQIYAGVGHAIDPDEIARARAMIAAV